MSSRPVAKDYPVVEVRVTVQRRPPGASEPYDETFTVQIERESSILHLLYAIRAEFDSSFSFPAHFCKLGNCGVCALKVNGSTRLTCRTLVDGSDLVIGPLVADRVICDLLGDILDDPSTGNR